MDRTTAQVELDEVLASVDAPSRSGMQAIFREFDKGFDPEKDSQAGRDHRQPRARDEAGRPGLDALRGTQSGDLTRVVRNSSRLMGVLARNELELGQASSTATWRSASPPRGGPTSVRCCSRGPRRCATRARRWSACAARSNELDPIAEDLRPGVRKLDDASVALRPALRELTPLLDRTDPMLRSLRPALSRLGSAGTSGVKLMDGLDPTIDRLNDKLDPGARHQERRHRSQDVPGDRADVRRGAVELAAVRQPRIRPAVPCGRDQRQGDRRSAVQHEHPPGLADVRLLGSAGDRRRPSSAVARRPRASAWRRDHSRPRRSSGSSGTRLTVAPPADSSRSSLMRSEVPCELTAAAGDPTVAPSVRLLPDPRRPRGRSRSSASSGTSRSRVRGRTTVRSAPSSTTSRASSPGAIRSASTASRSASCRSPSSSTAARS